MDELDVIVVGAGLSGIGLARHLLHRRHPGAIAVLEARDAIGGTWDLFRYPGVRSDSDMYTLGYAFRPWHGDKAIADGAAIRRYIRDTARDEGVDRLIRFGHRVTGIAWYDDESRWHVTAETEDGTVEISCRFVVLSTGYYDYAHGYSPDIRGLDDFAGTVVHPQHWPADLDVAGRRVAVIGSGATAITLVPALAADADGVTLVQRSPTYIGTLPSADATAAKWRGRVPDAVLDRVLRWKHIATGMLTYRLARHSPERMKGALRSAARRQLPEGFDVRTHFTPRYEPWDQRLCLAPDGDFFRAIRHGKATVVTGTIERVVPGGVLMTDGTTVDADVLVTATGLNLQLAGGMTVEVDGERVDLAKAVSYRGTMLSGVPNLAMAMGYTNASWTLKIDLIGHFVTRLLDRMSARGADRVVPRHGAADDELEPFLDLKSGYIARSIALLPQQGRRVPWRLHQNYLRDIRLLRHPRWNDGALEFRAARSRERPARLGREPVAR